MKIHKKVDVQEESLELFDFSFQPAGMMFGKSIWMTFVKEDKITYMPTFYKAELQADKKLLEDINSFIQRSKFDVKRR